MTSSVESPYITALTKCFEIEDHQPLSMPVQHIMTSLDPVKGFLACFCLLLEIQLNICTFQWVLSMSAALAMRQASTSSLTFTCTKHTLVTWYCALQFSEQQRNCDPL